MRVSLRRVISTGTLCTLPLGLLLLGCNKADTGAGPAAPLEVDVLQAAPQNLTTPIEFVGQTKGAVDVEIRARVEGVITGVHFQEGKGVVKGDLLYTIDPAPFLAKLAESRARLSEAETRYTKAQSDLARIAPLAKIRAVSQKDLDGAVAMEGVARGSVDAAKASLEAVNIEVSYTNIAAPVSGIIGLTKAKVGEFVGRAPNAVVLTTVSQLNPIHVRFNVGERDYLYFAKLKQKQEEQGVVPVTRELTLVLGDDSLHTEKGGVTSVDSQIDPTTGSIAVEASFPNPNNIIRPGQFAKIKTTGEALSGVITVPKEAVRDIQGVRQIIVVNPNNTAEVRTIQIGKELGNVLVVKEGLAAGELFVPQMQARIKSGMLVVPKIVGK
jgi:membrane fusion protein (multidrug efflux system)